MKYLTILGSTGSIGRQTLEVIAQFPEEFKVIGLGAGKNIGLLKKQIMQFKPKVVCVLDRERAEALKGALPSTLPLQILYSPEGYSEIAVHPEVTLVVSAMVGISGLRPTLAALKAGKTVALANKETLVAGGAIVKEAIQRKNQLLPVDSEHSAIFQLLLGQNRNHLKNIILTASGGPFWNADPSCLASITPEQAVKHPRWSMGAKISVDSATLMNKGLEVIEAMWLFELSLDKIRILIHPQSVVHSLIEFVDGVIFAHLSQPDMRLPITFALQYPKRTVLPIKPLNLCEQPLSFYPPDLNRFPCLRLALEAAKIGGSAPVVLNAANEVAVEAFLAREIGFMAIPNLLEKILQLHQPVTNMDIETIFELDTWARKQAREWIKNSV
ncbi:MAG: 1-deoxy-D-xylulose-5-phosphate reductoisomerase [Candidatus Desulfofervidaceae bacterium]|nr:1-deoxy-D-xylulose-5-phosphate reductoisomerase [Candidatus Desulfofervidaceae bacterium]